MLHGVVNQRSYPLATQGVDTLATQFSRADQVVLTQHPELVGDR